VERPLKLNFQASEERVARLEQEKAFDKLDATEQAAIKAMLENLPDTLWKDRSAFEWALKLACNEADLKLSAPVRKAVQKALSERDEDAEVCRDAKGNIEPDSDLRDTELVPLGVDWETYVAEEVMPFVPDAWVDTSVRDAKDGEVGRVGYEINFNRYFYKYEPPRPLEKIDEELKALEAEIAGLLKEVAA
jgi:type I restriction enzyme M protein